MAHRYATAYVKEHQARAVGLGLPVSTKESVNVCNFIRSKALTRVKRELAEVIALKRPVPFLRYNMDVGHKAGMAAGRYPVKACEHIVQVLASAEANAQNKGLNVANLFVKHICAHKGAVTLRGGRRRGRVSKNTHIEVVLAEKTSPSKTQKVAQKKKAEGAKQ